MRLLWFTTAKVRKKAWKLPPIPEKTSVRPPENFQTAACFLLPSPSFARMATAFAQTTTAFVQMPVPAEVSSRMSGIFHPHKPMFSPAWAKECPRMKRHRRPSTIANQPQCFLTFFVHLRQTIGIPQMARFIDLFAGIGGVRIPFDELATNAYSHRNGTKQPATPTRPILANARRATSRKSQPFLPA